MIAQVVIRSSAMSDAPIAAKEVNDAASFIDYSIYAESRSDHFRDLITLFVHRIAIQPPRSNPGSPAAHGKIQGEHVSSLDSRGGRQSRADRFASPRKTSEVVIADAPGEYDARKLLERTVNVDLDPTASHS